LIGHFGHELSCVTYGGGDEVAIECGECHEILVSYEREEESTEEKDFNVVICRGEASKNRVFTDFSNKGFELVEKVQKATANSKVKYEIEALTLDEAFEKISLKGDFSPENLSDASTYIKRLIVEGNKELLV